MAQVWRGWTFRRKSIAPGDPAVREMLLLSGGVLVPTLQHNGVTVWDALAISANAWTSRSSRSGLLQADRRGAMPIAARSPVVKCIPASRPCVVHCGMNLKAHFPDFKVWPYRAPGRCRPGAGHLERIAWKTTAGPTYFRQAALQVRTPCTPPVVTRFMTYDVLTGRTGRRVLQAHDGLCGHARVGGSRQGEAGPGRQSMRRVLRLAHLRLQAAFCLQGHRFGAGIAQTGSPSIRFEVRRGHDFQVLTCRGSSRTGSGGCRGAGGSHSPAATRVSLPAYMKRAQPLVMMTI